jgi:hypothetical protein
MCCAVAGVSMVLMAGGARAAVEAPATAVRKTVETFDEAAWGPDAWNKAGGTTRLSAEVAPEAGGGKCLEVEVRFAGKGFEHFAAAPAEPLVIPGDARSVTMRFRAEDKRYPVTLHFRDGWGRMPVSPKKLEWSPRLDAPGQWATATFRVPDDWVRPVTILGVGTHNWSAQNEARTVRFWIDALEVETDLRDVDPATGVLRTWKAEPQPADPAKALTQPPPSPLLAVEFSTGQVSNVFSGEPPAVALSLRNWKPGTLTGTVAIRVADGDDKEIDRQERAVSVESAARLSLPVKAPRYGLYAVRADLRLSDGTKRSDAVTLACLPPGRDLSEAEKRASPYGVNVNGGGPRPAVVPFRKAGIVWFRDYAFGYEWLLRAKGDDKKYAGWPWYPAIMRRYAEAGAKVLPCLMKSLRPPQVKDGKAVGPLGPDREWTRQIVDIVQAFPQVTHWELDNEYDLRREYAEAEQAVGWRNMGAYHRKLAEVLDLLGNGGLTAVEQGHAGIWADRSRLLIAAGDYEKVGVLNCHHYCGSEPPETNIGNWNTGFEGHWRSQPPMLFFDRLRDLKRAAGGDGRPREAWLTEFGWDTLAGPRVSPRLQAAYLARCWMMAMAAGIDKCFWFYDYDAPAPRQFFDGCGLLAADGSPKLSLCALAGLASVLPTPKYVGSLSAGDGTGGYVFQTGGDLVAALWTIEAETGPEVAFKARDLRDFLGNPMAGLKARLSPAPVYAVGLDRSDPLYRQTAYSLATPWVVAASAGDTVTAVVEVNNNRDGPMECRVTMAVPKGWTAERTQAAASVPKGGRQTLPLPLTVAAGEALSTRDVRFTVSEGGPVKEMVLRVLVRPALAMEVAPLEGRPGPVTVAVRVANRSARPLDGVLRLRLPASWQADAAQTPVAGLKPGEVREVRCGLRWSADWKADETAMAEFDAGGGRTISRPIIPNRFRLHRAKDLVIDGRLDDWPAAARMPAWMLGSTSGEADARVCLAWAPEGLYGAVEVPAASLDRTDPRSFWSGNCLELFIDSRDRKGDRAYEPGDHQFWFVPLVDENRVYVGQWKRGGEIPETRYDIRGVRGAAIRKGDGYVMEFLLPTAEIQKFKPAAGGTIGLNLNLTIKGKEFPREVYWPAPKSVEIQARPGAWGSMELVE